ncbi:MAG: TonB-dependent receptor [Gemmatimonadaceae bacterium]
MSASLGCVCLGFQLGAQEPDTLRATPLPHDSTKVQRLATHVVTGTRLSLAGEGTALRTESVSPSVAGPGPAAVASAMSRLPGVSSFDDQGTRAQPTLNLRGFTLSPVTGVPQGISVFLDGVRINEADAQQVYFDLIPVDALDRIELVRGPTAVYGKNTLAGTLLLSTRRGTDAPQLTARAEAGSFGYRAGSVLASGVRGSIDGLLMARASTEDGYRDETEATTRSVFVSAGRRLAGSDFTISTLLARDRVMQAGSLPESQLHENRRANFTGGDFLEPRLFHLTLRGERAFHRRSVRGNIFHRRVETEQFNVNIDNPSTRAFVRTRSFGGTAELTMESQLGRWPATLTAGLEYARNLIRYRIFNEPTLEAPLLDPECDAASGLCENASVDEDNAALFAQVVVPLATRLSLSAAARGDYVRVPFRDLRNADNDGINTFWRFSPRLGADFRPLHDSTRLRVFASIGTGFRAPAPLELACASESSPCPLPFSLGDDPPLEPVSVESYEAGLEWRPHRKISASLIGYRSEVRDEIVFVASQTLAGYFQNIPRSRRQGAEFSARVSIAPGLWVDASYTYLDATYQSLVFLASAIDTAGPARPGDRFPLSPAHRATFSTGATRSLTRSLAISGEIAVESVSSQYLRGDDANEYPPLPARAATSLRMGLDQQNFGAQMHVSNLFNQRFQTFGIYGENPRAGEGVVERFLTPGYPRAVTFSLSLRRE